MARDAVDGKPHITRYKPKEESRPGINMPEFGLCHCTCDAHHALSTLIHPYGTQRRGESAPAQKISFWFLIELGCPACCSLSPWSKVLPPWESRKENRMVLLSPDPRCTTHQKQNVPQGWPTILGFIQVICQAGWPWVLFLQKILFNMNSYDNKIQTVRLLCHLTAFEQIKQSVSMCSSYSTWHTLSRDMQGEPSCPLQLQCRKSCSVGMMPLHHMM